MRVQLQIIQNKEKRYFHVYDDTHAENGDLLGVGWTVTDAVRDFCEQLNSLSFYDDDTPVFINESQVEVKKSRIFLNSL